MSDDLPDFQLSASLSGHEKDVRAVRFPVPGTVFTASRDCSVQAWHASADAPPTYSAKLLAQGSFPISSLTYLPPSESRPQYPSGLVLAGSHGQTVEIWNPEADLSEERVGLLTGHTSNVAALDASPNGDFVVSGDWDGKVKLWNTATWTADVELVGPDPNDKQRAIWTVLAYSNTIVVTGSADHVIRGYTLKTKQDSDKELQPGVLIRTPDVVRALCRVRKHPSGAQIASAGNDFMIRLWQFNGAQVGALQGHESYIYALDSLPSGELVSSSEDRTVRIWKGESCVQTITHPALSIWSVSVCQQTGDFATGSSDNVARIFTRSRGRVASPATLREFEESVRQSAIPQQQIGDVNPSTLPGPEFIETKSGTKDGQTVMINSGDGNISQNQWLLVGTVVDSSANDTEGTGSGLGLGGISSSSPPEARNETATHPLGPHAVFITLAQANFAPALKRITTVNGNLSAAGDSSHGAGAALSAAQLEQLTALVEDLETNVPQVPATVPAMVPAVATKTFTLEPAAIALVLKPATTWPYKDRLPSLDIMRFLATSPSVADYRDDQGKSVLDILFANVLAFPKDASTGLAEDLKSVENNAMMVLRLVTNLFVTTPGQQLVASHAADVVDFLANVLDVSERKNRNLLIAWASAASNITSFALREQETLGSNAFGGEALARTIKLLAVPIVDVADAEVVFRALVALGNLVSIPGEGGYAEQARSANARTWVRLAIGKIKEDRIQSVGDKILKLLES
ncbi:polyubiquitin-binding protein [Niveomyces insectorum RCEF 264]|uniref:Polyubiquitin-binding protein n=1 Tax=Niveomyces insectorum RCEF 264 TaxID=1081102 RepID=A0A167UTT1_9HYPO|nr:polyubiquitin-binding protein [Niveomyces insectorum RCEF 264]